MLLISNSPSMKQNRGVIRISEELKPRKNECQPRRLAYTAPAIEAPMNSITSASIQSERRVQVEAAEQRVGCFNQELRPMVSPDG